MENYSPGAKWNIVFLESTLFLKDKKTIRLKIRGFDAQGIKIGVDRSDAVFSITIS